jgi:plastocyanin
MKVNNMGRRIVMVGCAVMLVLGFLAACGSGFPDASRTGSPSTEHAASPQASAPSSSSAAETGGASASAEGMARPPGPSAAAAEPSPASASAGHEAEPSEPSPSATETPDAAASPPEPSAPDDAATSPAASSRAPADAPDEEPAVHVVEIKDFAFSPETLEIRAGDAVKFVNRDDVGHTATADDGSFDTGILKRDEEQTVTFAEAGEFPYYCEPHPGMRGTIVVK